MSAGKTARRRAAAAVFAIVAACGVEPPFAPDADPLPPGLPSGGGAGPSGSGGTEGEAPASGGGTGHFTGLAGHAAGGGVTFSVNGDVGTIAFADDFTSTRVPDPHVYLNTTTDANRGTPLRIATIVSPTGAQTYTFRLPTGIIYTHVLVWCDRYNVGVGAAQVA